MRKTSHFLLLAMAMPLAVQAGKKTRAPDSKIRQIEKRLEQQRQRIEKQEEEIQALHKKQKAQEGQSEQDKNRAHAIEKAADEEAGGEEQGLEYAGIEFSGYGTLAYSHINYGSQPDRRDYIDLERLALEMEYHFSDAWKLETELEFEHGGTGASADIDRQEEFGEFEKEIESGGEVNVEELFVEYQPRRWLGLRLGRMYVPIGLLNAAHKPQDYFTAIRPASETTIIPVTWSAVGADGFGRIGPVSYQALFLNGLDSSRFGTREWISLGAQHPFEQINAEAFAFAGRLDYNPFTGVQVGTSFYIGDSNANRPKPDLDNVDGTVTIWDAHAVVHHGPWTMRALYLQGHLANSAKISQANKSLSNALDVPRTSVGSEAETASVAVGYNVLPLLGVIPGNRLDAFVRIARYDSQKKTEGDVPDNPISERRDFSLGLNYRVLKQLIFKADYTYRKLGTPNMNLNQAFSLGLGFTF